MPMVAREAGWRRRSGRAGRAPR